MEYSSTSKVELTGFMGGDDQVAMSAWVSFGNNDEARLTDRKRVAGLINFLQREKHATPFESSAFTFAVETPIFVAREFFRHRSASYNEWSGRYSEMIPKFYLPAPERPLVQKGKAGAYEFIPGTDEQYELVINSQKRVVETAWESYMEQLDAGIAKEVARNILPLNIYTRFYVTMNSRNLMHFLGLRTEAQALEEIQEVGFKMEAYLNDEMPLTYNAWKANNV